MRALLVYPEHPATFWNFKYALRFVGKQANNPPLGLMTVAAMLPNTWHLQLIDMNVAPLRDEHLRWADYVFLSAASIQRESARAVIERCRQAEVPVVAGGPLFTAEYRNFEGVDHFVLNEAELTLPHFLKDLEAGFPRPLYLSEQWAALSTTPLPRRDLIDMRRYAAMNIQYSRGCPFNCEFCDITSLFGREPRTKSTAQISAELSDLYARGWRGSVFIVDDNFIGNKYKLKTDLLPALAAWNAHHNYPFTFFTQASINLADDPELMRLMVRAGFDMVFVGIETPHEDSLAECDKTHNRHRDLLDCVHRLHASGLQILAGFIVGFDHDPPTIFDVQAQFIQNSGIAGAMVGLLNAVQGTRLYDRLNQEGRLLGQDSGNSTDFSTNFKPAMGYRTLLTGYRDLISKIYSPDYYYARVARFIDDFRPGMKRPFRFQLRPLWAFIRSWFVLGLCGKERKHYWKLLLGTLFRRPAALPLAVTLAVYGYHYRKIFENKIRRPLVVPQFETAQPLQEKRLRSA